MPRALALTFLMLVTLCGSAQAQTAAPDRPVRADCPSGVGPNAPAVGRESHMIALFRGAEIRGHAIRTDQTVAIAHQFVLRTVFDFGLKIRLFQEW